MNGPLPSGRAHLAALSGPLSRLEGEVARIDRWGGWLAEVLLGGGRLLAAGNGGSAAQAQHLTGELVGRYRDDRRPLSALTLHGEASSLTAIGNDFGAEEAYARQVRAHGRPGDVLVALSTSGASENVLAAVAAAKEMGLSTWALTGPTPNPLAQLCHEALAIQAPSMATVQEVHLVIIHLLCAAVELRCGAMAEGRSEGCPPPDSDGDWEAGPQTIPADRAGHRPGRREGPSPKGGRGLRVKHPIVVIGDALLDRDFAGPVERLSPEGPVPVVEERDRRDRPGGAGLAAALAAADGRPVTLITALAKDSAGSALASALYRAGVEVIDLGLAGETPEKVRVRTEGRTLLRVDRGGRGPARVGPAVPAARAAIEAAAAVLVSDYGRGMAAEGGLREALEGLPSSVPVVWDPHRQGPAPVPGVLLATPNRAEASQLVPEVEGEGLPVDTARARRLACRWQAVYVCVTLAAEGALMAGGQGLPLVVPAPVVTDGDSCGAGDRFASRLTGLLADGALPSEAVPAAVVAASAFVGSGGAARAVLGRAPLHGGAAWTEREPTGSPARPGSPDSIADIGTAGDRQRAETPFSARWQAFRAPAPPLNELARGGRGRGGRGRGARDQDPYELAERVRGEGGTVVATGGCFDLLHSGHVSMLGEARALGDCLIVLLNSDDSVRRLKGPDRPLVEVSDRAAVLAALEGVDGILVFEEDTPAVALERLRPHLFAKGGDYAAGELPEAQVMERLGGQAVILPFVAGRSTTQLIEEVAVRGGT